MEYSVGSHLNHPMSELVGVKTRLALSTLLNYASCRGCISPDDACQYACKSPLHRIAADLVGAIEE